MGPVEWLLGTVLGMYFWVVIVGAVMSWLIAFDVINTRNKLVFTIYDLTERLTNPVLAPIRKVIPTLGGVDLSPVALLLGLQMLRGFVVPLIPF